MADLATLQAQLEALKAARGSAELRVRYKGPNGEEEVEYRSTKDLVAAIAATEADIAALSNSSPVRIIYPRYKGWS
jgi:hypothetical protein